MPKEITGFELPRNVGRGYIDFPGLAELDPKYEGDHSLRVMRFTPDQETPSGEQLSQEALRIFRSDVDHMIVPVVEMKIGYIGMSLGQARRMYKNLAEVRDGYSAPKLIEVLAHPIRTARSRKAHAAATKLLLLAPFGRSFSYFYRLYNEDMPVTFEHVPKAEELVNRHVEFVMDTVDNGISTKIDWEDVQEKLMGIYRKHLGIEAPVQDCSSHSGGHQSE